LATKRSPHESSIAASDELPRPIDRGAILVAGARLAFAEMPIVPDRIGRAIFAKNWVQAGSCVEKCGEQTRSRN